MLQEEHVNIPISKQSLLIIRALIKSMNINMYVWIDDKLFRTHKVLTNNLRIKSL